MHENVVFEEQAAPTSRPRAIADPSTRRALVQSARPLLLTLALLLALVGTALAIGCWARHLRNDVAARSDVVIGTVTFKEADRIYVRLPDGFVADELVDDGTAYHVGDREEMFVSRQLPIVAHLRGNDRALVGELAYWTWGFALLASPVVVLVSLVMAYRLLRRAWALWRYPWTPIDSAHYGPHHIEAEVAGPPTARAHFGTRSVLRLVGYPDLALVNGPVPDPESQPPSLLPPPKWEEQLTPPRYQIERAVRLLSCARPDEAGTVIAHRPATQADAAPCALWSPDGQHLGYVGRAGNDHWLAKVDGERLAEVVRRGFRRHAVIAGGHVVGSSKGGWQRTIRLAEPERTWQLTVAGGWAELVDDGGEQLALAKVRQLDREGASFGEMTTTILLRDSLDGDSRWIALLVVLAETGPPTKPKSDS